ncbi:MAG: retropepsin-like domain-containing protein [Streptomyces sp.]|nr:retropepsin-like domain-containing protein [Streptomyces sp.]
MGPRDDTTPAARHRLVPGLLAALLLTGCAAFEDRDDGEETPAPTGSVREVPLRVEEQGAQTLAFVQVRLQGAGPFEFALDTGASTSVVDDDVADRAGLELTGERRPVSGILGSGRVPVARVTDWEIGDVPVEPGEVTVVDLDSPRDDGEIQGLLGSDVLSDYGSVTVDYDDGVLRLPAP